MDREISKAQRNWDRFKIFFGFVLFSSIALSSIIGFKLWMAPSLKRNEVMTAKAEIGNVEEVFTGIGVVVPEFEISVTSPIDTKIKKLLKRSGESVKIGEPVLELDIESTKNELEKLEDEFRLKEHKKQQLLIDINNEKIELRSEYDIKKLNIEFLKLELTAEKKLNNSNLNSMFDLRKANLQYEIANRELKFLEEKSLNSEAKIKGDLKGLQIELDIKTKQIEKLKRKLMRAQTRTEHSGVITWVKDEIGIRVEEGDTLYKIADLSSYKVKGSVSDVYAEKLSPNYPVKVRFNDRDFNGRISRISPEVEEGKITFFVDLESYDHHLLKPNLRVEIMIITSLSKDTVRLRNGPYYRGQNQQKVFVMSNNKAIARNVIIGGANLDYIEIINGVYPGEEVVINNMERYLHHQEIEILED